MTTAEIVSHTGFKHNSVRGTLWTLAQERLVAKNGMRWVATPTNTGESEGLPLDEDGEAAHASN